MFQHCPQSYANRARQPAPTTDIDCPPAEEPQAPEGLGPSNTILSGPYGQLQPSPSAQSPRDQCPATSLQPYTQPPPVVNNDQVPPGQTNTQALSMKTNVQATSEIPTCQDYRAPLPSSEEESGSVMGDETANEISRETGDESVHDVGVQPDQGTPTGQHHPEEPRLKNKEQQDQLTRLLTEPEATISQVMQQLQEDLPAGQPSHALEESAPPSSTPGDCSGLHVLLDLGFQDLPFPGDAATTISSSLSSPPLNQPEEDHQQPRGRGNPPSPRACRATTPY